MQSDGQKILPFYLVVDVSASMTGDRMTALNNVVPQLVDALARDPILSDKVRFALSTSPRTPASGFLCPTCWTPPS